MVTLSCFAKKNKNLSPRKKSSVYYWKWRFPKVCGMKTQLSLINWTLFPRVHISIIFARQLSVTIIGGCITLFEQCTNFFCFCGYMPPSVKLLVNVIKKSKSTIETKPVWGCIKNYTNIQIQKSFLRFVSTQ